MLEARCVDDLGTGVQRVTGIFESVSLEMGARTTKDAPDFAVAVARPTGEGFGYSIR